MKLITFLTLLFLSLSSFAHEGHGDMPTEPAKYGGILGNVVSEIKMLSKEKHNPPLIKAEIVRSEDGTIRIYLYDLKMEQLKLDTTSKEAKGVVENTKSKTKDTFNLLAHGDHFMGKMPNQKKKPFNIYITFSRGTEKLFVGFDNLD
jgi:hypothetical protein